MRRFLLTLFISGIGICYSQDISVKSFQVIENDMDARVNHSKHDQNGEVCAIIKVVTTQTGFSFDVGSLGVVGTEQKKGEVWVYVPRGVQRITINHSQLGVLRNYGLNIPIMPATVYELILTTKKVTLVVDESDIESQWLIITSIPEGANVFIDNMMVGTTPFQRRYREGQYSYRVELLKHHTQAGSITIKGNRERVDATLKPNFGKIRISSSPENGMAVYLNDNNTSKITPATLEEISSGEHTISVIDNWYQPQTKKVTIKDNETTFVNFQMKPAFANITINATQNASIHIDEMHKGNGKWTGRLFEGIYKIKVEKEKYYSQIKTVEFISGKDQTINFSLNAKTGSLDIATIPLDATVSINDKVYGTTPLSINDLIIGKHSLTINKEGYGSYNKSITIEENKTLSIEENLPTGAKVKIESDPSNSSIFIDGMHKGYTPINIVLGYGKHQLMVEKLDDYAAKEIVVSENSDKTIKILIEGEHTDWQRIKNSNRIYAFEQYKKKYPRSAYNNYIQEVLISLKTARKNELKNINIRNKREAKIQRLARQQSNDFLIYNYDKDSYFGISRGYLSKYDWGWYLNLKTNNFWKDFFVWIGDDYYSNDRFTGKTALWNCYLSGGPTLKLFYPLWLYGGFGAGYSMKLYEYDLSPSTYYSEAPNPDYYGWEVYPESGLLLKISNKVVLKYGLLHRFKNNKGFIHQFGLGFTF